MIDAFIMYMHFVVFSSLASSVAGVVVYWTHSVQCMISSSHDLLIVIQSTAVSPSLRPAGALSRPPSAGLMVLT